MRVRRDRMLQHYNQQTYRAIEAENARAAIAAQEKRVEQAPAPAVEAVDERDPVEVARAAARALRGDTAA